MDRKAHAVFLHFQASALPQTMNRQILAIPKEEVESHFAENLRQDFKVVAPEILTDKWLMELKRRVRGLKMEYLFDGIIWQHSLPADANRVCLASEFDSPNLIRDANGPFAISFANAHACQDEHYHKHHLEIYVSDHPMSAEYRAVDEIACTPVTLPNGGVLVFAPDAVHKVSLTGFTVIIELPAVAWDKTNATLHAG